MTRLLMRSQMRVVEVVQLVHATDDQRQCDHSECCTVEAEELNQLVLTFMCNYFAYCKCVH